MDPEPHKYKKGDRVYVPDLEVRGEIVLLQGEKLGVKWFDDGESVISLRLPEQVQLIKE
jgi:hypothetical protein